MKDHLDRREALKLAGLLSMGFAAPQFIRPPSASRRSSDDNNKNILIIVFDAFSAYNMSLYGYPRETTPNISKLADRAIVYHNHYAGGNFTTPGTASLLTGNLPWNHRAFNFDGTVDEAYIQKNIFHVFDHYYRFAYTHNSLANTLLDQFIGNMENYIPPWQLFLDKNWIISSLFDHDKDISSLSWVRFIERVDEGFSYSLFLSQFYEKYRDENIKEYKPLFPRGIPRLSSGDHFILEDGIDWLQNQLPTTQNPFLGYFHFLPPHTPYYSRRDFVKRFKGDGYQPVNKPDHIFNQMKNPNNPLRLDLQRTMYDEFILYVDSEFQRLFESLDQSGILEDTILVFTSDHGELFERGIRGHTTESLHQPVVRIPLLIFDPDRENRTDICTPTRAIDVLPTLLHATGQEVPDWIEGTVIPPYSQSNQDPLRSIFSLEAKDNNKYSHFTKASSMIVRGKYKLMYFFGYEILGESGELIELYDIENDPEELINLYPSRIDIADPLVEELKAKLDEVNKPYK